LIVSGKVVRFNIKSGFNVAGDDFEYFMPLSQSFLKADQNSIGKQITAYILDVNQDKGSILISRKKYILEQQEKSQALIEEWQKTNEPRDAKVVSVINSGIFVDIDGINGLVPFNEISHKGPINPKSKFKIDDEVRVVIKEYTKENGRLNLSIKDTMNDPWEELKNDRLFKKGDVVVARVCNLEKFGAFVSLPNGLEALLHVSQISYDSNFLKHPNEFLTTGDDIKVQIMNIDKEKKQIQVSLKALAQKPFDTFSSKYNLGDIVHGKVVSIKDFGAFINLGSMDGLLHNDNLSWENKKCIDELKIGDEIEVKIAKIENEKVWLSKKALTSSPSDDFAKKFKKDDIITRKIVQIVDFGVFVELAPGLDALIRTEDLSENSSELNIGDDIEAAIVFIDTNKNQIRLSCRKVDYLHEKEALGKINADSNNQGETLGDLLGDSFKKL
jgi:small subunit ribosomal protein S1